MSYSFLTKSSARIFFFFTESNYPGLGLVNSKPINVSQHEINEWEFLILQAQDYGSIQKPSLQGLVSLFKLISFDLRLYICKQIAVDLMIVIPCNFSSHTHTHTIFPLRPFRFTQVTIQIFEEEKKKLVIRNPRKKKELGNHLKAPYSINVRKSIFFHF